MQVFFYRVRKFGPTPLVTASPSTLNKKTRLLVTAIGQRQGFSPSRKVLIADLFIRQHKSKY